MAKPAFIKLIVYAAILIVLTAACAGHVTPVVFTPTALPAPWTPDTRIPSKDMQSDAIAPETLAYLGAFRLPEDGARDQDAFSWGGEALAYNPHNDSLFIVGHDWFIHVAEITLPAPAVSKHLRDLPQAQIITPFSDIKGRLFDDWILEIPRVGLEVLGDKLFFCMGEHLEDDTARGTHGFTTLDLAEASKACVVGDALYATNDYLFKIPERWQAAFGGADLFTGRFRDGGWSGQGPSLFAISSAEIVSAGMDEPIAALPVVRYDTSYIADDAQNEGRTMDAYSHADSWTGGAFIQSGAASAVVLLGTHGWGQTWYGFSNGVTYPVDGADDAVYPPVPPYPHDARGWWNDDFRATMLFYDPAELANVANGTAAANAVQPYAMIDLSDFMLVTRDETAMHYLGGAAYDDEHGVLYVLELFADADKPVVHAFMFDEGDTE